MLDRSNLIPDIFAKRARSAQAKAQVELAQYQYLLPALPAWDAPRETTRRHRNARSGRIGGETDRRAIRGPTGPPEGTVARDRKAKRHPAQATRRIRALGPGGLYERREIHADEPAQQKRRLCRETNCSPHWTPPFARWYTTGSRSCSPDTVGFIRKLPHGPIESFKSTLDEVREADVLLHVVDISHPQFEDQIAVVKKPWPNWVLPTSPP